MKAPYFQEMIIFFNEQYICKQLLYKDFKVILEGKNNFQEFSLKSVKSAYVQVNHKLEIIAVVLFKLNFDSEGYACVNRQLPLIELAMQTDFGPLNNGQQFRLACRSQCPINGYQDSLWDPAASSINELVIIKNIVKRNILKLFTTVPTLLDIHPATYTHPSNSSQIVTNEYEARIQHMTEEIIALKQKLIELKYYKPCNLSKAENEIDFTNLLDKKALDKLFEAIARKGIKFEPLAKLFLLNCKNCSLIAFL